jgi:hypothetical protein
MRAFHLIAGDSVQVSKNYRLTALRTTTVSDDEGLRAWVFSNLDRLEDTRSLPEPTLNSIWQDFKRWFRNAS